MFPKSDESLNMIRSTIRADENVVEIYVDEHLGGVIECRRLLKGRGQRL
jgi:hypothetical protein